MILDKLKDTCFLRRLSVPKAKLNEVSVDLLVTLLSKNTAPNLIELDISWNELTSISMQKVIKGLKTNRKL